MGQLLSLSSVCIELICSLIHSIMMLYTYSSLSLLLEKVVLWYLDSWTSLHMHVLVQCI